MSGVENNRTTDVAKKTAAPSSATIASASEKRSPWGVLNLVDEEHRTPSPQQLPTAATIATADKSNCGKGKGSENKAPKQIILNWNPFLIGRNETTSVIIPNPCISGVHCIFSCVRQSSQHPHPSSSARQAPTQVADGEEEEASNQPTAVLDASIADTSTNGCYVNGARLGKGSTRRLVEGDEIDLVISKKAEHSCFDIKYRFSYQVPLPQRQPVKVTTSTHQQLATAAKKNTEAAPAVPVKPIAADKDEQKQSRVVTPPPPPLYPGLKEEAQQQKSAKEATTTSSSTAPRIPMPVNADQQALPSGNPQQQVPAAAGGGLLGRVGSSVVSGVKGFFKLVTGSNQQMDGGQGGGAGGGVPSMMGPTALDATTEAAGGGGMVSGGNSLATKNQQTSANEGVTISAGSTMKKVKSNIPFEKRYAMSEETVLGKGSFATVYKAIKTDNGQVVAIKEVNMARTLQHMKDRADGEAKPVALTNEDEMKRRRDELRQKREIEILQAVSHPHVVQLLDFEHVSARRLAFVLEFAHGGELFGLIKKLGHLEEDEAAVIAKQLLYGVCYLHSIGVVHRDLKLENILLRNQVLLDDGEGENGSAAATGNRAGAATPPAQTSRPVAAQPKHLGMTPMLGSFRTSPPGKSGAAATGSARAAAAGNPSSAGGGNNLIDKSKLHIKIADFGLSRILSSEDTLMSTMCGTPIYVAPEVTMHALRPNRSGYTSAADMWSVGVIVYALLCGRPPFPHAKDEKGYRHKTRIEYNSPIDWTVAPLNSEQTANRKGVAGRGVGPSSSAHPRTPASLVPTRPGVVRPGQPYHHQHQQHAGPQVISMHARSFLSSLLVMKPEGRSTAHEALNHPWLRDVVLPEGTGHPPSSSSDLEQQEDDDHLKSSSSRGGEEKRSSRTANKQQRFGNTVMEDSQLFDPMRLPPPTNAVGDDAVKKSSAAPAPGAIATTGGSIRGDKKAGGGSTGMFGRRKRLRDPKQPEDAASTSSGDLGCSDNDEEDNAV